MLICLLVVRLTEDQELFSGVNLATAATGCIVGKIRFIMWVKTTSLASQALRGTS